MSTKTLALLAALSSATLLACSGANSNAPDDEPDASAGGSGGQGGNAGSGGQGGNAGTGGRGGMGGQGGNAGSGGSGGSGGRGGSGGGSVDARPQDNPDAGGVGTGGKQDAAPEPKPDGGADTRVTPLDDGGVSPNPALDERCTVPIKFTNTVAGSPGGMIFDREIPDAVATMQKHARAICRIIYRQPEEVKNVKNEGLTIDMHDGVAYAAGGNITFSAAYINDFSRGKSREAIAFELNGVLVHEGTHVWQYTNGGGWLVEAMADYVRFKAGFDKLSRRQKGGNWDHPYTTGGFFIAWIEDKYDKDFGYKVNMGMKQQGFNYANLVKQITGKDVNAVWTEYQNDI